MTRKELSELIVDWCSQVLLRGQTPELPDLSAKEWDTLLYMAARHGVLSVITPLYTDRPTEDVQLRTVFKKWYAISVKSHQNYQLHIKYMRELSRLMGEEGIDVMFMKGVALAQLYPNPEWRWFSDIDYYLYGKSEQGIRAMAKKGIKNTAYYHHHTQATFHGVLLENHYDFVERVNHRCNLVLDDALKALAQEEGKTLPVSFLGEGITNAYLMTPTMSAIFLMRHMSSHFVGESIPFRMLYDWALFLDRYAGDVDWKRVTDLYQQSGMTRFAGIIMQILRTYVGFECKDCPLVPGSPEDAEKVWRSMIVLPKRNRYNKYSLKYFVFEARTFFANRWKHKIVYPNESFAVVFLKYAIRSAWFQGRRAMGKTGTDI